jgi:hypothetical protein
VCQLRGTDRRRVECHADKCRVRCVVQAVLYVLFFGDADMSRGFVHDCVTACVL